MKILLIIFILFVALSPLISMAPGKRQRQIAGLRQRAQQQGMQVTLAEPPAAIQRQGTTNERMACYKLRRHPDAGIPELAGNSYFVSVDGGWRSGGSADLPAAVLAKIPAGVVALVIDKAGCSAYWDESGGDGELDALLDAMRALIVTSDA